MQRRSWTSKSLVLLFLIGWGGEGSGAESGGWLGSMAARGAWGCSMQEEEQEEEQQQEEQQEEQHKCSLTR